MNSALCCSCHADRFINPEIELLMSTCFHLMCTKCIDRIFVVGRQTQCPQCHQVIKKHLFQLQLFEDISIEKDLKIRKRVDSIYNQRQEDFDKLDDFNNYIEHKEELIMNLLAGTEIAKTEKEIKQYELENREAILNNQYKEHAQQQITKNKIQDGDKRRLERHSKFLQDSKREKQEKAVERERLLKQLELGMDYKKAMKEHEEKMNIRVVDPLDTLVDTQYSFFNTTLVKKSPFYEKWKQYWKKERCQSKNLDAQMIAGGFKESDVLVRASQELSNLFC